MKKVSFVLVLFFFTVLSCQKELPAVIKVRTLPAADIMATSASLEGQIIDVGEGITDHGHCWAEHSNPQKDDFSTSFGPSAKTGSFYSEIEDLQDDTRYYFRCWAEGNDGEVKYGDVEDFTTSDGKASISTSEVTDIELYSATSGGNITSAGGSEVIKRGVCWSTEEDPTVQDSKTEDGSGLGDFTSSLSGLTHATDYYVKAYAITEVDTTYGSMVSFSTYDGVIDLTTSNVIDITATSATSGGTISDNGGSPVTARGVCWSTSQNPTIADNITDNGSGTGSYSSSLTGLTPNTTYYLRAYATNSIGTAYGNEVSFTTIPLAAGEVYNPATGKIWMDRNLGASRVATSSTDAEAYGDLYQWGRAADGHEKRNSPTTSTLSSSDTPGHGNFITVGSSPIDWRSPQNDNLWQGVNGTNNPCPSGYRLPTAAEWEAERQSWSSNNSAGAFASPLKLPVAGRRGYSGGSLDNVGAGGYYWSSTVGGTSSRYLYFYSGDAFMRSNYRAYGSSVRCIKDE